MKNQNQLQDELNAARAQIRSLIGLARRVNEIKENICTALDYCSKFPHANEFWMRNLNEFSALCGDLDRAARADMPEIKPFAQNPLAANLGFSAIREMDQIDEAFVARGLCSSCKTNLRHLCDAGGFRFTQCRDCGNVYGLEVEKCKS